MKFSRLTVFAMAGLLSASAFATTAPAPAATTTAAVAPAAATFSPAQKAAIEQIIHDYLISHPEVLIEAGQALQMKQQMMMQQQAQKAIPALVKDLLNDPNSPVAGNAKAPTTIVEFFDYQCPHCKAMAKEIDDLVKMDPNVRIVYKELPIFGPDSEFAAKAALASQLQGKFEVFNRALLTARDRLTNQAVLDIAKSVGLDTNKLQAAMNLPQFTKELQANAMLASKLGIGGTPAFVIINVDKTGKVKSQFNPGQTTKEELEKNVQAVR